MVSVREDERVEEGVVSVREDERVEEGGGECERETGEAHVGW